MEKQILFLFVLVIFTATLERASGAGMTMEQLKKAAKMLRNSCGPKSGANKESLEQLSKGILVEDDQNLKCYMKCVQGMMQMNNKKGRFDPVHALTQVNKAPMLSPELREIIRNNMEFCRDAGMDESDACDLAFAQVKCHLEHDRENFFFP